MYSVWSKLLTLSFVKWIPAAKLLLGIGAIFTVAAIGGLPIHDFWFDLVLFQFAAGIVGGEPEPDTQLTGWKFAYTWYYRTTHLWVAAATTYFSHQTQWSTLRDGVEQSTTSTERKSH